MLRSMARFIHNKHYKIFVSTYVSSLPGKALRPPWWEPRWVYNQGKCLSTGVWDTNRVPGSQGIHDSISNIFLFLKTHLN